MTPKELKLKMISMSKEVQDVMENEAELEGKMKVVSFVLTFWQEQAQNLISLTKAKGELKELALQGLDRQRNMLIEKIKSER